MDPDQLALAAVQQYLNEQGWVSTLQALEKESKQGYDPSRLPQSSYLLQIIHGQLLDEVSEPSSTDEKLKRDALSALDAATPCAASTPSNELLELPRVHGGPGITCLAIIDQDAGSIILSGAVNGSVAWTDLSSGKVLFVDQLAGSGILSTAVHPTIPTIAALGCMDGGIVIVDSAPVLGKSIVPQEHSPEVLARCVGAHRKYVVSLAWSGDGHALVSGAWDDSVALHAWDRAERVLRTLRHVQLRGHVTALLRAPGGDGRAFLVAVRGESALLEMRVVDTANGGEEEERKEGTKMALDLVRTRDHSLNEDPTDTHVSFSAMALALSSCGRFLAAATDAGRVIVLAAVGEQGAAWRPVRRLFGLSNADRFHIWSLAWGAEPATPGSLLAVAAPGGEVKIYAPATASLLCTLRAHSPQTVRAIACGRGGLLVTASLDGSIKVFGPEE